MSRVDWVRLPVPTSPCRARNETRHADPFSPAAFIAVVDCPNLGHGGTVWKISYLWTCVLLGLLLGWVPMFFHGPIPEKFDQFYISGSWAVWAWYLSRMSIGLLVGVTVRPRRFWLRGLLVGGLVMLPLGFVSLAVPTCGPRCMGANILTGAAEGLLIAGLALWLTGRQQIED